MRMIFEESVLVDALNILVNMVGGRMRMVVWGGQGFEAMALMQI